MAEVGLLPFARVALQVSKAVLPRYRSRFSKRLFNQPQLLAILCLMRYEDGTFREAEVRLSEHRELGQALGLASVPDFTTLYRFRLRRRPRGPSARFSSASRATDVPSRLPPGRWSHRPNAARWRRARSARSSCGACIIMGKSHCRGGTG
jgi:hypothetical protein